jgi:hypothetical protein
MPHLELEEVYFGSFGTWTQGFMLAG